MNICSIFHAPFEGLGTIREWIDAGNHALTSVALYRNELPPAPEGIDAVIIMGGPMSVYDDESLPWLKTEKEFISTCLRNGTKALGICLGAQLLAHCLGGVITKNKEKEIGWFPVRKSFDSNHLFPEFDTIETLMVFHWHGETFSLPANATHLFSSKACMQQGFVWNDRAVGLQFHLEMDKQSVRTMLDACAQDLQGGPFVQSSPMINNLTPTYEAHTKTVLFHFLDNFLESGVSR